MSRTRILFAHNHPAFRDGLTRILESKHGFEVVCACDGSKAVQLMRELQVQPDILLIYTTLWHNLPWNALRAELAAVSATRAIVLTAVGDRNEIEEVFQRGARGIVNIGETMEVLIKALRAVMAGKYWVLRESLSNVADVEPLLQRMREKREQRLASLTGLELDVVSAVSSGFSNKEIAEKMRISEEGVKDHLASIFEKLGIRTRLDCACAYDESIKDRSDKDRHHLE